MIFLAAACGTSVAPNADGIYSLPGGYELTLTATAGEGTCDWWSVDDYPTMSEENQPGFCLTTASISGEPQRYIIDPAESLPEYSDELIHLQYVGSENGSETNITIKGLAQEGPLRVILAWGDEDDDTTWATVELELTAVRFSPD